MRMKDVDARKAYIQKVRSSFDSPGRRYEFEKEPAANAEAPEGFPFFKARLFVAALLFAAYVLFDQTGMEISHISMKRVSEEISRNFNYEDAKEGALQAWRSIREK